jgi:short-subunit dehydrogenase
VPARGWEKPLPDHLPAREQPLFLCARNESVLNETGALIAKQYPQSVVHCFAADLSVKEQVISFADFCLKSGTPDVLINNAGTYLPGNCFDEPDGTLEQLMQVNVYSAYHLTRKLVPLMIERKSGHIFNICSVASLKAYEGGGGYSMSKFALYGFSQNLRQELLPHGIKVTAVLPGAVMTDSWAGFDNSSNRIMEAADIAKMVIAATQLSKQAVVEDIVIRPQLGDL